MHADADLQCLALERLAGDAPLNRDRSLHRRDHLSKVANKASPATGSARPLASLTIPCAIACR